MRPTLKQAILQAQALHEGTFRNDGVTPYENHLKDVAARFTRRYESIWCPERLEIGQQICWLHDAIEMKRCTRNDLMAEGYDITVVAGVIRLTRQEGQTYADYINQAARDEVACAIKICDVLANISDGPADSMIQRYASALLVLLAHERQRRVERDLGQDSGHSGEGPCG